MNMPLGKVGIITPVYATPDDWLLECLQSVQGQAGPWIHYIVWDGDDRILPALPNVRQLRLPGPHDDAGCAARAVGGTLAIAEGCDAITYLDADNRFRPDHIATLRQIAGSAAILTTRRMLIDLAGQPLALCPESDGERFTDTSCLTLRRAAFSLVPTWAVIPKPFTPICDRMMWTEILRSKLPRQHLAEATVEFRTQYRTHYEALGRPIPEGAKTLIPEKDGVRVERFTKPR